MARTAREIMSGDVQTVASTDTVAAACKKMRDADVGDVLVTSVNGRLCGIVTDRDVAVRAVADDLDPFMVEVDRICSHELVSVSPDDEVTEAARLLREQALRRLPVVENGQAIGMVSIGDLARELDPSSALADISAAPSNN